MTSDPHVERADRAADAPRAEPVELSRWAWRQLTSMRTALVLLFLLALAAVPGSVVPQTEHRRGQGRQLAGARTRR